MPFFIFPRMKSKSELRKEFKQRRSLLSIENVDQASLDIANKCLELKIRECQTFHLYLTIEEQKEVQTDYILHILQGKDKNVVISRSDFENCSMSHYLLTDQTTLVKNQYGIPEPAGDGLISISEHQIDVVFVPLLAVDRFGNRIGYGKGFYDRFLSKCKPETIKVGLSFFEPLQDQILANENDVRLDYLVTPHNVHKL